MLYRFWSSAKSRKRSLSRIVVVVSFSAIASLLAISTITKRETPDNNIYSVMEPRKLNVIRASTRSSPATLRNQNAVSMCRCNRSSLLTTPWESSDFPSSGENTTCVGLTRSRVNQQQIISYSFYGAINEKYFGGIERNLLTQPLFFPNWTIRVYLDLQSSPSEMHSLLCQLACKYDYVDFCDVNRVSELGNLRRKFGMVWRFLPLGDPSVDRFIVRDTDSLLSQRDSDAVEEWIQSGKGFHVMRDHPDHGAIILGGLWGAWNRNIQVNRRLRELMVNSANFHKKGQDQVLLATILAPYIFRHKDVISHDSYLCWLFPRTQPFPTRRHGPNEILGTSMNGGVKLNRPCPEKCRPKNHPDWTYC